MKTSLRTYLKQFKLEKRLHISTENPKGFNDTVIQHFADELKHCNSDMPIGLQWISAFVFNIFGCYVIFQNDLFS